MKTGYVKTFTLDGGMEGVKFTLGRMIKMIQDARKDPLVIATARKIAEISTAGRGKTDEGRTLRTLKGLHAWGRANFQYVADPENVELIQTPNRMLRALQIPMALQKAMWEPIGRVLGGKMPAPRITGDSDESTVLVLSLAAAIGLGPLRIDLGGHDNVIQYAWGGIFDGEKWRNLDILNDKFDKVAVQPLEHLDIPMH